MGRVAAGPRPLVFESWPEATGPPDGRGRGPAAAGGQQPRTALAWASTGQLAPGPERGAKSLVEESGVSHPPSAPRTHIPNFQPLQGPVQGLLRQEWGGR